MSSDRPLLTELKSATTARFQLLGCLLISLWAIEIIDFLVFGGRLNQYGIRPRSLSGLWGIGLAPFLHGDFKHLMANSIPLLTLSWWVMLQSIRTWVMASVIIAFLGGAGTWLLGGLLVAGSSVHIGASGVIFGYVGFLLGRGYYERTMGAIAVALFILVTYGAMFWGLFPTQPGISWESHLFGFISGIIAAYVLKSNPDMISDR
ncbi:rhomboid family intramembrane serine protease [Leptothoe kymatousa]|uniref:Rhomboid family intramembrane serine protease n=1 Tax=Leptothoe kymatousa TAU-MAC 1615 TaxID=2364775 RepID=A0ABS5Y089_9CYAN|nr:rhomboid family intramembrane serine protease [Leptothoe kymatousa]MBT9311253.1 rhomboid family intramembrane serine protease [Leptothoe kymatousa TAU-MAC 1615]